MKERGSRRTAASLAVLVAACILVLAGCRTTAPTHSPLPTTPTSPSVVATPSAAASPASARQLPALTSENGVQAYMAETFKMLAQYTKGVSSSHPSPTLVPVTASRNCQFGGQKFLMGDGAPNNGTGAISACRYNGLPVIMYGPQRLWKELRYFNQNQDLFRSEQIFPPYVMYLVMTNGGQNACQLGRILGGLADAGLLPADRVGYVAKHMDDRHNGSMLKQGAATGVCN